MTIGVFRHATPAGNESSIRRFGLLSKMSQGKRKCVWLHLAEESLWALQHVGKRHSCSPAKCVVFRVMIDAERVKKGPRKGLYWVFGDISPAEIIGCRSAADTLEDPEGS
jgi:hypothetical protein